MSESDASYFLFPPLVLPLIIGVALVVLAVKFLDYTFARADYVFDVGLFGGFVIFAVGLYLVLSSFFITYLPPFFVPPQTQRASE